MAPSHRAASIVRATRSRLEMMHVLLAAGARDIVNSMVMVCR